VRDDDDVRCGGMSGLVMSMLLAVLATNTLLASATASWEEDPARRAGMDAIADAEVMEWEDYKLLFRKPQYGAAEESFRRAAFEQNIELIKRVNSEHDAGNSSVRLGVNDFADMTNEEYRMMLTFKMSNFSSGQVTMHAQTQPGATIDWRAKGAVTAVKNQYRCGGCWSFAAIAATEGAFKVATGALRVLSEQQLLDCSNQGGCLGGETPSGLIYIEMNQGVDTESEYSWKEGMAPNPPPKFPCWKGAAARHAATIFNHTFVKVGDESQMAAALMKSPLATAVDADSK
jgi:KDEL-tailed cysteine endopeptidase